MGWLEDLGTGALGFATGGLLGIPAAFGVKSDAEKKQADQKAQQDRWDKITSPEFASDAYKKYYENAQGLAAQTGAAAAQNAAQQSTGAARASGLSPAQAALMASQQSGQNYTQGYTSGLQSGIASQAGITGANIQNVANQQNYQMQQQQLQNQQNQQAMNLVGSGLSAAATVFSDERLKTDIRDGYGILTEVTKYVSPKMFKYRGGSTDHAGVMAQDLEKTPLAGAVIDTPQGKMVDTRHLTTANTAMISELSKKVDTLANYLKAGK